MYLAGLNTDAGMSTTTLTNQYPSLQGKSVFITGGGTGIGAHIVREFCRQGSQVTFVDIDQAASEKLVMELGREVGREPLFICCDVRDIAGLQESMERARESIGALTTLVNNAARDDRHSILEVTPEYWDECLDINLRPHFFSIQNAAGQMREGGSIINMGSIGWMRGRPDIAVYTTSKGAISALTRTMARELGPQGIRVNSVVPGAVITPRQQKMWLSPEAAQEFLSLQSLKFHILPDDVVAMVMFLASDDSRACTGQNFIVDAGVV